MHKIESLRRASTFCLKEDKDVDDRDNPDHDGALRSDYVFGCGTILR